MISLALASALVLGQMDHFPVAHPPEETPRYQPAPEPAAPTRAYQPVEIDAPVYRKKPRSKWGSSWTATLSVGFDRFFNAPLNVDGKTGSEIGVRVGGGKLEAYLGAYLPNGALIIGADLFRQFGIVLLDYSAPAVKVGLLLPDIEVRWIVGSGVSALSAQTGLTGIRVAYQDFFRVELRGPTVGAWASTVAAGYALSWGLALDAGIFF